MTDARDQHDQDLEENQSERNQKYREERMDQFLQSFDDTKEEEQQKLTELEGEIPSKLSWNLVSVGHLPTSQVTEQNNFAISEFHQQQESGIQQRSRIEFILIPRLLARHVCFTFQH